MASTEDTVAAIVQEIAAALSPLADALESPGAFKRLMARLGWRVDDLIGPIGDLGALLTSITDSFQQEESASLDIANAVSKLAQTFSAIRGLSSISSAALPPTVDSAAFKSEFPRQIVDYLLVEHLLESWPRVGRLLQLAGVIRLVPISASGTHLEYIRREVAWSDLAKLFSDPIPIFANAYRWGQSDLDGISFLRVVTQLGQAFGISTELGTIQSAAQNAFAQGATVPLPQELKEAIARFQFIQNRHIDPSIEAGLGIVLLPETGNSKPGFAVVPYVNGTTSTDFALTSSITAFARADASLLGGLALAIRPDQSPELEIGFLGGPAATSVKLTTGLNISQDSGEAVVLLGQGGGSRIEGKSFSIYGGVRIQTGSTPTAFVETQAKSLALVIKPAAGQTDGFLANVLPSEIRAEFDLTMGLESQRGFYFEGSGGLEILLPIHITLGPIEVQGALVALKPTSDEIAIDLAATFKADLSVLKGVVENVGVRILLKTPAGGGQLGPFDIAFAFRPPNGVGLSVDAGVIRGGGYLSFDVVNEEYAGALDLVFSNFINLKAIGLITTKMPDGSKGFSLLIIITAEFGAGIQLGYGFKLIGVGGLLGLNRTVCIEPLAEGVRTGAVNNIMFPQDIVANAPRIISDLRTIFPPELNKFLIGPMAKLGWGTPTLISLSLGIIIEIPGNIAILGVLSLALPDRDKALVVIQVNFVGAIEFDKKRVFFFAEMFESRVLFITLEGGIGVLAAFGEQPNFVVTVGGFNPRFNPPPLPFPNPRRIALSILNESWGRIRIEAYFATTSNTAQFGARAELYFGFPALSVEGYFGFDALFRFVPFQFIVDVSAAVCLKVFGVGAISIYLEVSLEGFTPNRVRGHATVHILCFEVTANIDQTWGEVVETILSMIGVLPLLIEELKKPENWISTLPPNNALLVSLRKLPDEPDVLVLHPLGSLRISQRAVPLDVTLDKVGNQKPSDATRLLVREIGGSFAKKGDAPEQFAAAQYQDMTDAEKLSRPAFEPLHAGLELSVKGTELNCSQVVTRVVRYDQILLDTNYKRVVSRLVKSVEGLFLHFLRGNAATKSTLSKHYESQRQPFEQKIHVKPDLYAVVYTRDNRAVRPDAASFTSEAEAREFIRTQAELDPNSAAMMHVISTYEMKAA